MDLYQSQVGVPGGGFWKVFDHSGQIIVAPIVVITDNIRMQTTTTRTPQAKADPIFVGRWSPRSYLTDAIPAETLDAVFEAARWAPSCYNEQPWLIRYIQRDSGPHADAAQVLVEGNRVWAENAPVIGVIFSRRNFRHNEKPNSYHTFDTGAAAYSMALQASMLDLGTHFMGGFDPTLAYQAFDVDESEYQAQAAFVIGKPGPASALPDGYAQKETPSDRRDLADVAQEVK